MKIIFREKILFIGIETDNYIKKNKLWQDLNIKEVMASFIY